MMTQIALKDFGMLLILVQMGMALETNGNDRSDRNKLLYWRRWPSHLSIIVSRIPKVMGTSGNESSLPFVCIPLLQFFSLKNLSIKKPFVVLIDTYLLLFSVGIILASVQFQSFIENGST